ncbi:MAG: prepilin-type N-terminal cleavage/methylation domain-containing protein [Pseudomonadales bacterium]
MNLPRRGNRGFTLIELIVVIIMLTIVVGIVAKGLGGTPGRSREVALVGTLASLRKAIDVYQHEHGTFPGLMPAVPPKDSCRRGVMGEGKGWPDRKGATQALIEQLTSYSAARGGTCSVGGAPFLYGPYFRSAELPANPITGSNEIAIVGDGDLYMRSDAKPPKGWKYDVLTGKLIADDPRYDQL